MFESFPSNFFTFKLSLSLFSISHIYKKQKPFDFNKSFLLHTFGAFPSQNQNLLSLLFHQDFFPEKTFNFYLFEVNLKFANKNKYISKNANFEESLLSANTEAVFQLQIWSQNYILPVDLACIIGKSLSNKFCQPYEKL